MAIDPNIALGVRGVELQNPLNALAQFSQIQGVQQANKLNQMQMAEYERARNEEESLRNYLSGADLTATDTRNALMAKFGKSGREFAKGLTELDKAKTEEAARKAKLAIDKTSMYRDMVGGIASPADAVEFMKLQATDPDMAGTPITRIPLMKVLSSIPQDPMGFETWKKQTALGMTKFVEQNKPSIQTINQGGQTQVLQTPGLGGAPTSVGTYADVPLPAAVEEQKKRIAKAGASNINLPAQEKAFESELGKGQAENLLKSKTAAQDAASIIDTVKTGRDIMKSGMITGAGADFLVNLNQGLKTVGIDAGYADAAANSQAFTANMAGNVGKLIKQFGAGTGLSDADREFAKDMAGGRISLDAKAINRILDINERAARNVITRHNKDVKGIKTNIPLEVELPPEIKVAPPTANVVTNPQFPGFSIGKP